MTYSKAFYIAVDPVGSKFAKALQQAVRSGVLNKVLRVDHDRANQKLRRFGNNRKIFRVTAQTLNKIEQFQRFAQAQVSCPAFTVHADGVAALGRTVFARTLVNSTGGRGIVEFDTQSGNPPPRAPLYTEYIPKKAEYRVHVFGNQVIDVQQKKKKRGFEEDRNTRVRNLVNGYVYTREGIAPPDGMGDLAVRAVAALGYQYGAVDIIYNERRNACFVLEVNSRPGLMGTTVEKYADALINLYDLQRK